MRIHLVHVTTSLKVGGAEKVLYELACSLPPAQFVQTVLYVHDGPYKQLLLEQGIACYQITGLVFRYDPLFFWRLYRMLKRIAPDCLHTLLWAANCSGRMLGRMLKIPVISVMHNNIDQDGRFRNSLDRLTVPLATRVIAVSDEIAQALAMSYRLREPKLHVIKNGVNYHAVCEQSKQLQKDRSVFGLSPEHMVIGSVGRFEPVKRYDLLLESFAQVYQHKPQARLLLVGFGSQQDMLCALAIQLGCPYERWQEGKRIFVSHQDRVPLVYFMQECPAYGYYPLMDLFVQTSDKEGISLALLEAMSLGVACVVTHAGTYHPVIMHEKEGFIVPAGNRDEFARTILEVCSNRLLRKKIADAAQKKVQQEFSQQHMHAAYARLFESIALMHEKI
jgi:glycosyltransferase involved in cell wall biosynthesis